MNKALGKTWAALRDPKRATTLRVNAALAAAGVPRGVRLCRIEIEWHPPDRVRRDPDGLGVFGKFAIDAIKDSGRLVDDSSEHVTQVTYRIAPPDKTNPRVEIRITEEAE